MRRGPHQCEQAIYKTTQTRDVSVSKCGSKKSGDFPIGKFTVSVRKGDWIFLLPKEILRRLTKLVKTAVVKVVQNGTELTHLTVALHVRKMPEQALCSRS